MNLSSYSFKIYEDFYINSLFRIDNPVYFSLWNKSKYVIY